MPRALLSFPELVFEIDASTSKEFASELEDLRAGNVPALTIRQDSNQKQRVINIIASHVPEGDFYWKNSQQLTIALSPEAFEHLMFKLEELNDAGGISTPEFYEFQAVDEERNPIPRAKTLRTFLSSLPTPSP